MNSRDDRFASLGPDYHWRWWISRTEYRNWISRVLSELPDDGDSATILDIGCGDGVPAYHLAARGYQVVGVDYLAAPLEIARNKVPAATFITDFPTETFDYVLILDALYEMREHPDLIKAVQNCHHYALVTADPSHFSQYAIERLFRGCGVELSFEDSSHLLFIVTPRVTVDE